MILSARPRAALAPYVGSLTYYETAAGGPRRRERRLPDGTVSLVVNLAEDEIRIYRGAALDRVERLPGAVLAGVSTTPYGLDTDEQRHLVMVDLRPGALPALLGPGAAPEALADENAGLDRLWGGAGAALRERLLEAGGPEAVLRTLEGVLADRVRPEPPDRTVVAAVAGLERGRPVADVADGLGLTGRGLLRRFRREMGLAPKRYARVRRLQRLLGDVRPGTPADWAALAAAHGYFDQPHLTHEFGELTGITPGAYEGVVVSTNHLVHDEETSGGRA